MTPTIAAASCPTYLLAHRSGSEEHVTVREGTELIAESVFKDDTTITGITLPSSLRYIDDYAFDDCTKLQSITLQENVTLIYRDAFRGAHINTINLPNSLETIGSSAFEACSRADGSATVVNYAGTEAEWANVSKAPADATAGTNAWDHNANLTITFAPTT